MNARHALVAAATLYFAAVGCAQDQHRSDAGAAHGQHAMSAREGHQRIEQAVAVLHPTQGNNVSGTVRFTQLDGNRVRVVADVRGLTPNTTHGFHIHEYGDCSAPDATSAGGHYNPGDDPHGGPDAPHDQRHAGDLGNIQSNAQGSAQMEMIAENVTLAGSHNPILGRAVIVHAKADDLKSQPTGDAGARIACGVIGVANTEKKQ